MADLPVQERSGINRLVGRDEQSVADVRDEGDGINRLAVSAQTAQAPLGTNFFENVENSGDPEMGGVDGSGTPITYELSAHPTNDRLISRLRFYAIDEPIKTDDFLSEDPLINGLKVEIRSENNITTLPLIFNTTDFLNLFSGVQGFFLNLNENPQILTAEFVPRAPFFIKKQGSFATDDYIRVIVQDDLDKVDSLKMLVTGTLE